MMFVAGDTHGALEFHKLNTKNFPQQRELTKDDFVIVVGDFGGVWSDPITEEESYWLDWLNDKNFTTLFCDGNHENFPLLNEYPVEDFHGGKVHKIKDSIYHLMRGQIFTLDNSKFFVMGGADSYDKMYRTMGEDWWWEEMPSNEEYDEAINNLKLNDWKVDYVITHCAPDSILNRVIPGAKHNQLTNFLEVIVKNDLQYKKWYFGHYHKDLDIDEKHTVVYNKIIQLA